MNYLFCNYDYVEFWEGDVYGWLIGWYCGMRFFGNLMVVNGFWIKFWFDEYGLGIGFLVEFNISKLIFLIICMVIFGLVYKFKING